MRNPSKFTTSRQVDDPLVQNADFEMDADDRQYIDNQIRGLQQWAVEDVIPALAESGGETTIAFADADITLDAAQSASLMLKLTGANTSTRALVFPLPATQADSYFRLIEMGVTGAGVMLKMSAGSTWTIPQASGGAIHLAIFTPSGVTVLAVGGTVSGALQYRGSTGFTLGDDSIQTDPTANEFKIARKIRLGTAGTEPTITAGTGAPATTEPNGSIYLRTDGTSVTGIYVREAGAWSAVGGGGASPGGSANQVQVNDGAGGLAGATDATISSSLAIGASPATAGDLRLTSTGKIMSGSNLTVFEANSTSAYVCTSSAFGGQFNIANLYAASAVALGLASSTYQYLTGGNNEAWKPRTGSATGATPYASEKAASQAMADADQTAAAAVYMAATIVATGALTALRRITLPDATDAGGYRKTINNTTTGGFGLVIAVSTGTTVTLGASKTADVWIDSRGVTRLTPDT